MSTIISPERTAVQQPQNIISLEQSQKRASHYTLYVFFSSCDLRIHPKYPGQSSCSDSHRDACRVL